MHITRYTVFRWGIVVASILVSVGILRSLLGYVGRTDVVGQRQEALKKELERNRELNERFKEATSAAFVEKQAREKLGLAREGETIVLFQKPAGSASVGVSGNQPLGSRWERWWKLFF